mgnify:CR=1 FL=1
MIWQWGLIGLLCQKNHCKPRRLSLTSLPRLSLTTERLWVPQADKIWFRPLILNTTNGEWVNLLRIAKGGVMNRHRHPAPVYGYVLKGEWRYLEHDWVAKPGTFVFEPPGEIHTLVVDEEVEEMITLFHVFGALVYYDEDDNLIQHDDVHTKIEM